MDRLILREEYTSEDALPTLDGRTLTLRLATIGRMYEVAGRGRPKAARERIEPGAFKEPLARPRGVLRFRHLGERPGDVDDLDLFHGVMTALREADNGASVVGDFEVFEGHREDKLLRLVEQRAVTGASMSAVVSGARQLRDERGPFTSITKIRAINGASITPAPGYDDAEVVALRERHDQAAAAQRQRALDDERAALAATRSFLASVGARM
jgi:phage head maturation protease